MESAAEAGNISFPLHSGVLVLVPIPSPNLFSKIDMMVTLLFLMLFVQAQKTLTVLVKTILDETSFPRTEPSAPVSQRHQHRLRAPRVPHHRARLTQGIADLQAQALHITLLQGETVENVESTALVECSVCVCEDTAS